MANERTALAWLRTALSVVAAGVGLTTLARVSGGAAELDVVARETDRSTGRSNTGPEAEPPVVEVSDRGVTDHPTATKE
jgi:hypothetical protein